MPIEWRKEFFGIGSCITNHTNIRILGRQESRQIHPQWFEELASSSWNKNLKKDLANIIPDLLLFQTGLSFTSCVRGMLSLCIFSTTNMGRTMCKWSGLHSPLSLWVWLTVHHISSRSMSSTIRQNGSLRSHASNQREMHSPYHNSQSNPPLTILNALTIPFHVGEAVGWEQHEVLLFQIFTSHHSGQ